MNRIAQLQDQAEFLRSLADAPGISLKREHLLKAAEQCEALAASLQSARTEKPHLAVRAGEPYLSSGGR
jgi:hypothetical protein